MTEPRRYEELLAQLAEERSRLEHARSNYEIITQSRFHALRMLWFSLKQIFGKASPGDAYAVWSKGFSGRLPALPQSLGGTNLSVEEHALIEAWNRRQAETPAAPPIASVIIPVFNRRDLTTRCLRSIADSWFASLSVQFIVVDDGSTDDVAGLVTKLKGVQYVRSSSNDGFIVACNTGAAIARGHYLCFLNNDTVVRDGWLDHLVSTAESDERIGAVGAKLVYPDGRLQEAGAIVWRDATGWNVGRGENPEDPRYNYVHDVDYVSGAALLIRRELFHRVAGFSDLFRPAYYEDVDLCFKIRELGFRVVYQPRSVVTHIESATSGNARTGVKRFQEINRSKFLEKWKVRLCEHFESDRANVARASLPDPAAKTILFIDTYVPMHDREAGSQRLFRIIEMLRDAGYNAIFFPDNFSPTQPYTGELQRMGVQVLYHVDGGPTAEEALRAVLPAVDIAWVCRPEIYQKHVSLLQRHSQLRIIYDTVDLHHVRKRREALLNGSEDNGWQEWQRLESDAARSADCSVAVSAEEKQILEDLGARRVFVIPTVHEPATHSRRSFEDTSGLLFVGNFNHPPNVDAAKWLCEAIMPLVWEKIGDVQLTLAGANPTDDVLALKSSRVSVTGYVPDLTQYFRRSRLFVAPLRFGAGMKGKVGHALQFGLPIVTTSIGAEGFSLSDGQNAAIVSPDAKPFADAVVDLYTNRARWLQISASASDVLAPLTRQSVLPVLEHIFATVSAVTSA